MKHHQGAIPPALLAGGSIRLFLRATSRCIELVKRATGSFACDLHMVFEHLDKQCWHFWGHSKFKFCCCFLDLSFFDLFFCFLPGTPRYLAVYQNAHNYMKELLRGGGERATREGFLCCCAMGSVTAEVSGWEGNLEIQTEEFSHLK